LSENQDIYKPKKVGVIEFFEVEHEVSPAFLAEINEVYGNIKKTFKQYPESKHFQESEEQNMILGWLAEKLFDMILNEHDILHVWYHPLIQDEMVKERKKVKVDFRVHNDFIDVKASSHKNPSYFFVGCERAETHPADFYVFFHFDKFPEPEKGWLSGWISSQELKKYPKKQYYQIVYEIPRSNLKPFSLLLQRWKRGRGV